MLRTCPKCTTHPGNAGTFGRIPTVSSRSNLDLVHFVEDYLHAHGIIAAKSDERLRRESQPLRDHRTQC